MSYKKISCQISKKDLDSLSIYFFNQGCLGTEIIEKITNYEDKYGEIYPPLENDSIPKDKVIIIAYFERFDYDNFNQFIKDNKINLLNFKLEACQNDNYEKSFQDNFPEITINDYISIIPPWFNEYKNDITYVIIEPGTGFGTGYHESTQLAIKNLLKYYQNHQTMLDFGTGSGILAILGKKLGIDKVYAIDIDDLALKNALKNATLNQVEIFFENKTIQKFTKKVTIVIANIIYDVIVKTLDNVKSILETNGVYIISGILVNEQETLINILENKGFEIIDFLEENNWVSLVTKLKS